MTGVLTARLKAKMNAPARLESEAGAACGRWEGVRRS